MSTNSSNTAAGGVLGTPDLGGSLLQENDFYQYASLLHPFAVGSIALIALFATLRFSSNRSVAPMNIFDVIVNVALGSTLAGIVNGNSLVRGLIGLIVLLGWQYLTSLSSCRLGPYVRSTLNSPPLVVVFRGDKLEKVMARHRINALDLSAALRGAGVLNISQVEACILESTGSWSIYKSSDLEDLEESPDVLMAVPAYKALVDKLETGNSSQSKQDKTEKKKNPLCPSCQSRRFKFEKDTDAASQAESDLEDKLKRRQRRKGSDQQKSKDSEEETQDTKEKHSDEKTGGGGECTDEQNDVAESQQ